jgi:glutamate synthase domain-containing protein 2
MNTIFTIGLDLLSSLFIILVGCMVIGIVIIFIIDITQTKDAIRRNYPVIGRLRYIFSTLGEFFRQYFFAMDREEMPFNRAERNWVYNSAKDQNNTVAFGSTKNLNVPGTPVFVNCPFPTLTEQVEATQPVEIGPYCPRPYKASSFFNISGMSYGAISKPAVQALARGAKMAGCWMNTGEGGLSPYHLESGCDIVFQIGTAKYGVKDDQGKLCDKKLQKIAEYDQVKMFEIKLSQGAKPGKGGIIPASKITSEITEIRGISQDKDSASPNRHPEVNNPEELLDMVEHVRAITGKPTGFKMAIGTFTWLEIFCEAIHKRGIESAPDFITIDSGDGGTGAAPMPLIDNVGLLIREALPLVCDVLSRYGLKKRICVIASGKLIMPSGVAWALAAGADFITSARGFMFSLGCIQALRCNKNTCPTGITTHKPHLQRGLDPQIKSLKVANYHKNIIAEVGTIAHSCGVTNPRMLKRKHVRIIQYDGRSIPMDELYPYPVASRAFI